MAYRDLTGASSADTGDASRAPCGPLEPIVGRLRMLEIDHEPDGWPAVQMRDITRILNALDFYRSHCELLQRVQHRHQRPKGDET